MSALDIKMDTEVRYVTLHRPNLPDTPVVQLAHFMLIDGTRTPWQPITLTTTETEWLIGALQTALVRLKEDLPLKGDA